MKALILGSLLIFSINANAECARYCNPEKSKPCGKGCISKDYTCHKPVTTSCAGKRGDSKTSRWIGPNETESRINELIGLQG